MRVRSRLGEWGEGITPIGGDGGTGGRGGLGHLAIFSLRGDMGRGGGRVGQDILRRAFCSRFGSEQQPAGLGAGDGRGS